MSRQETLKTFLTDEGGATALEYAVMLGFLVLAIYSAIEMFGGGSNGLWLRNTDTLNPILSGGPAAS